MTSEKRQFKGVWIPALVYLNREVSWNAKIIWCEVDNFTSSGLECFFSNEYLAQFLGCSIAQVTRYLGELKTIGWIEEVGFDGRKRYIKSLLDSSFLRRQDMQIRKPRVSKNDSHRITKNNIPNEYIDSDESGNQQLNLLGGIPKEEKNKVEAGEAFRGCVNFWLKVMHIGWRFKAMDGKQMKDIIQKIRENYIAAYTERYNSPPVVTPENIIQSFEHFCKSLPEFYKTQDLKTLNSKFDGIIEQIKSGRKPGGDYSSRNSADRFSDFYGKI